MSVIIDQLEACSTGEELDKLVVEIASLAKEERTDAMYAKLQEVAAKDFVNSKNRRKVSRCVENRDQEYAAPPEALSEFATLLKVRHIT
jgi:hypothetical protein